MNTSAHNWFNTPIGEWRRGLQYWQQVQEIIARRRYEISCTPLVLNFDKSEDIYDELYYVRPTEEIGAISK